MGSTGLEPTTSFVWSSKRRFPAYFSYLLGYSRLVVDRHGMPVR